MGNCVPAQKSMESAKTFNNSENSMANGGGGVRTESPVKDNNVSSGYSTAEVNAKIQSSSLVPFERSFRDMSNREDMFFDSHACLDSDCEDYLSIDGDFTPSSGTTPIHHNSSLAKTPPHPLDESLHIGTTVNSIPEPSPPHDMKKQLIELFQESFGKDPVDNSSPHNQSTPNSVCSGERTPSVVTPNTRKQKPAHSVHCCLPNLVRSLSSSDRKKRLSTAYSVGQ